MHIFNGHKANFYTSTGQGSCSSVCKRGQSCPYNPSNWPEDAKIDAEYFCTSFYGPTYKATSFEIGKYGESGKLGYIMHKVTGCTDMGEDIEGTDCSGVKCKIFNQTSDSRDGDKGLYNIVCSDTQGI